jgi:hypothetical protein
MCLCWMFEWEWCFQRSVEGNVTSYNLYDSCSIKMRFHLRTVQIYITFSGVCICQTNIFYFEHEIDLPLVFLDIWTHIWNKFFVNWRQFYNLSNNSRKKVYFSAFGYVASRVDTAKWRKMC